MTPHDLSLDLAQAMLALKGEAAAHRSLLDRASAALLAEPMTGRWWHTRPGVGDAVRDYLAAHLLRHLREGDRGSEATDLVFRLEWLRETLQRCGPGGLVSTVTAQAAWARIAGRDASPGDAAELRLLVQALKLSAAALRSPRALDALPDQLAGRLQGVLRGEGRGARPRIRALVEEALVWRGPGGPAFRLRPVCPSLLQAGGACERVLAGHTGPVTCVAVLDE